MPIGKNIIKNITAMPVVKKSLDASMLRSRTIANNIANINTPGYKRLEVSFEKEMKRAMSSTKLKGVETSSKHMSVGSKKLGDVNAEVYRPVDPSLYSGVNNVNIDTEMAKLAKNQIIYNMNIKFAKGAYEKINAVIQAKSLQ